MLLTEGNGLDPSKLPPDSPPWLVYAFVIASIIGTVALPVVVPAVSEWMKARFGTAKPKPVDEAPQKLLDATDRATRYLDDMSAQRDREQERADRLQGELDKAREEIAALRVKAERLRRGPT